MVLLMMGFTLLVSCGEGGGGTDKKAEEFTKFTEANWVKIGIAEGWTDKVSDGGYDIRLEKGAELDLKYIDISYTMTPKAQKIEEDKAGTSGEIKEESKVTYAGIEFDKLVIESSGLKYTDLYGDKGTDTMMIVIFGEVDAEIEKMLNSLELVK